MIEQSRGGLFAFLDRRAVEKLLDSRLPDSVRDIRYLCWRPSTDLAYQECLILWQSSKEEYLEFVQARGLAPFSHSGPNVHLPVNWKPSPEIEPPDWWQPTCETPPDAASGTIGPFGSIVAKWEAGRVHVMVTDTGHRSPGGPS